MPVIAPIGAAVGALGGAASVAGLGLGAAGLISQSKGNTKAANAVTNAASASDATQRYIYDDTVKRNQFRTDTGNQALAQYARLYGLGAGNVPLNQPGGFAGFGNFNTPQTPHPTYGSAGGVNDGDPRNQQLRRPSGFNEFFAQNGRDPYIPNQSQQPSYGGGFGANFGNPNTGIYSGINTRQPFIAEPQAQVPQEAPSKFQSFYDSPDYQLAFTEGQDAIEGGAAARGGLLSGNTAKSVIGFGQNLANTTFGNYKNTLNNIAGLGQQANNAITGAGQQYATQFGNNQLAIAQANATRAQNNGNLLSQGLTGLGDFIVYGSGGKPKG